MTSAAPHQPATGASAVKTAPAAASAPAPTAASAAGPLATPAAESTPTPAAASAQSAEPASASEAEALPAPARAGSCIPYPAEYHRHISAQHKLFDLKLNELFRYRDLVVLFVKRTFTVSYKQTILGPAWLLLNPLLTAIMHLIVFGNIAKLSTDGTPAILFYFIGTALWGLFSNCLLNNSQVFVANANLFGKVYFPRLAVPVANSLGNIVKFVIQLGLIVAFLIFFAAQGLCGVNWPQLWICVLSVAQLALLGTAFGLVVSALTTKYRDLNVLVTFGVTLWMYASPVAYPLSQLGEGWLRTLVLCNPATAPIEMFRWGLLGSGAPLWGAWGVSWLVTAVLLVLGIVVFNKVERSFLDTV